MEYKEKYEMALERARQFSEHPLQEDSANIVEYIFPELKEPEDEKVRKTLIDFFGKGAKYGAQTNGIYDKDIIAWLEKQGKESITIDTDPDASYNNIMISDIKNNKKQDGKPQRMISAEAKEALYNKPTWSEEEVKINRIVACLENLNVADNDILLKDVEWLKSFKDRIQQKQEWSREDEAHINSIIAYLLDYRLLILEEDMNVANGVQKELDWLVSLKQRIGG